MDSAWRLFLGTNLVLVLVLLCVECHRKNGEPPKDKPRLTASVSMRDETFHSAALDRAMPYRVVFPENIAPNQKLQVVYLLHGAGGDFREWSNSSDVAQFAERGFLLVMPEGASSYYTNSVGHPQDRYEDYIVNDLRADVESKFPVATGRTNRAIVGISMGGFGAVKIGLHHPELYSFVGGMSSALDVPRRSFSFKRFQQSRHYREIFGPTGGQGRLDNDPFVLLRKAVPEGAPYFFLTCGAQEGLLPANREFAAILERRHFQSEFHVVPGGHDWNQWNADLPKVFEGLLERMGH